jgi:RecA-family ATPase
VSSNLAGCTNLQNNINNLTGHPVDGKIGLSAECPRNDSGPPDQKETAAPGATGNSGGLDSSSQDNIHQTNHFLNAAIWYAAQGWKVFPCVPNTKIPLVGKGGHHNATDDIDTIRNWWAANPNANIGINLKASGLVAVDPDLYKPECQWNNYAPYVDLPDTLMQSTPSGGLHYVYKASESDSFAKVLEGVKGVDIKHNGYIMLAPSQFINPDTGECGQYFWQNDNAPAPVPDWVTRKAHKATERPPEELQGDIRDIMAALEVIPNPDLDYEDWNEIGMATYAASGGHDVGYIAFDQFSRKSAKYSTAETATRWDDLRRSPPTMIGMGSLIYMAQSAVPGWIQPSRVTNPYDVLGNAPAPLPEGASATPVQEQPTPSALPVFSLADFAGQEPPELEWVVPDFIPKGFATLCGGPGGTGKSLVGLHLQISAASGTPFFGKQTARGRTLGFYGEEDHAELQRRTKRICTGMNVPRNSISDAHSVPLHGLDAVLAVWDGKKMVATDAYHQFEAEIARLQPECVIVDNVARVFSGNENDRMQVSQFVTLLESWAIKYDCAVLLMAHPAKAEGSEYSGSTAWESAVRSRLYFGAPDTDDDAHLHTDKRVLRVGKANLARKGTQIELHFAHGCFHLTGSADPAAQQAEQVNKDSRADQAFLHCLDALKDQNRTVSDGRTSPKYAPRIMVDMPEAVGIGKRDLERAMNRLFNGGQIKAGQKVGTYTNRTPILGIARSEGCTTLPAQDLHKTAQSILGNPQKPCTKDARTTPPYTTYMTEQPSALPSPEDAGEQHHG